MGDHRSNPAIQQFDGMFIDLIASDLGHAAIAKGFDSVK